MLQYFYLNKLYLYDIAIEKKFIID